MFISRQQPPETITLIHSQSFITADKILISIHRIAIIIWTIKTIRIAGERHHVWFDPRRQTSAAKETQKQGLRAITSRAGKNAKNPMGVFQTMPTSFVTLKTAAKLNPDSRPPYVVEMPPHLTTTYGGIFIPWNSFAFTGHEKSPDFEPGIYASICGARLPARTWARKPMLTGLFFSCPGMKAPLP